MRRPWISITALVIAVLAFIGGLFSYKTLRGQVLDLRADIARRLPDPSLGHLHSDVRLWMIKSQLSRVEHPIIVMGDSIVEAALLPKEICGHPVINAGIGGTAIGFFKTYAPLIVNEANPELVILSVGINDATTNSQNELYFFRSAYLATLESIRSPVAVVTITPTNDAAVNLATVSQFNRFIEGLAPSYSVIDSNKTLDAGMTVDGVHLNQSGYAIWNKSIERGIKAKLGC